MKTALLKGGGRAPKRSRANPVGTYLRGRADIGEKEAEALVGRRIPKKKTRKGGLKTGRKSRRRARRARR